GWARFNAVGLELSESPSLAQKGKLEIDAGLTGLRWAHEAEALSVDQAKVELRGKPTAAGGLHLELISPEAALRAALGARAITLSGLSATVNATFEPNALGHVESRVKLQRAKLDGPEAIEAGALDLSAHASELRLVRDKPLEIDGVLSLALAAGS